MLEIEALEKVYPPATGFLRMVMRTATDEPVRALDGVDLRVGGGETVGLVGPNGAGKTTLFRIVSTLLAPTRGSVRVGGHDVEADPLEARKRIGLLLEGDRGFYLRLTGRQNLEFFGIMSGLSRSDAEARADALMRRLGLGDRDKRVFGYSSGMRVRLALARALLHDPPLLLLDEPTRSLDPEASAEVLELISETSADGRAVLMASHRLSEVSSVCSRVALLVEGEIRFDGDPSRLITPDGRLRPYVDMVRD